MKKDFNTAIERIKNQDSIIHTVKKLEKAWNALPQEKTKAQIKTMHAKIDELAKRLKQEIDSVVINNKNQLWGIHGSITPENAKSEITERFNELMRKFNLWSVDRLYKENTSDYGWQAGWIVRRILLSEISSLGYYVKKLKQVQNQSKFANFFSTRFPVFVR